VTSAGTAGQVLQSGGAAADPSYSTAIYPSTTTVNEILYSFSDNNVTGIPTANFGVLVTNGTGVPSILSLLPNGVQDNITRVGTISAGTWQGGLITGQYGGTGVANTGRTITLGGNIVMGGSFTTTGANDVTLTTGGATNVTLPVTGTLSTIAGNEALINKTINGLTPVSAANGFTITGGAVPATLTVSSDATVSGTNTGDQTLAGLGGVPTTRLVNGKALSSDITLILASTDFANQGTATTVLHGNAAGAPAFGAVSLAADVTGTLPVANGGTGATTITNRGVLIGHGTSAVTATPAGTAGQVLQSGGAGADPSYSTATYPSTTNINRILYSVANNQVAEITSANNGILVTNGSGAPSIGNSVGAALTMPSLNLSASSNQVVMQSGGITGTLTWTPSASNKTITFPNASGTVALQGLGADWSVNGNAGTNPATNFLGTTDNQDLVLRANNTEWLRIESATGDIVIGNGTTNSGTIRTDEEELVLRQDGDDHGPSILRLMNRNDNNGAIFETTHASTTLVDFIFKTAVSQRNIRYEARARSAAGYGAAAGVPSFHLGGANPDDPTLALGDNYSIFSQPVRINNDFTWNSPTALLHLEAGTTTLAPLKFMSGPLLTSAENGAVEYSNPNYFVTAGTTRYYLTKSFYNYGDLDFPNTAAQSSSDLTIAVTGAAVGDPVALGIPNGSVLANSTYTAWVSSANNVRVRFNNFSSGALNPASGTFRVSVIKY
jgi:hypothetical protein